jgi:hypothetical protein
VLAAESERLEELVRVIRAKRGPDSLEQRGAFAFGEIDAAPTPARSVR